MAPRIGRRCHGGFCGAVRGSGESRTGNAKARGIYRDPVRSSTVKASGLRWLSLMVVVPIPWAGRRWALPFLTVLAPSERWSDARGRRHRNGPIGRARRFCRPSTAGEAPRDHCATSASPHSTRSGRCDTHRTPPIQRHPNSSIALVIVPGALVQIPRPSERCWIRFGRWLRRASR